VSVNRQRKRAKLAIKAIVSLALGGIAMVLSMACHGRSLSRQYLLLAITVFVMIWAGRRIYAGAWTAARHGSADMNALVRSALWLRSCIRWL